jgi:hypothetical protein
MVLEVPTAEKFAVNIGESILGRPRASQDCKS